jgi:hypothetical protein
MPGTPTIFLNPVGGDDGDDGSTFLLAKKTTQGVMDILGTSDIVAMCQVGDEQMSGILTPVTAGAGTSVYNEFVSYNAGGTSEEDGYTIIADGAEVELYLADVNGNYYKWHGVTLDANDTANFALESSGSIADNYYNRCNFINGAAGGASISGFKSDFIPWNFIDCTWHDNAGRGLTSSAANQGRARIVGGASYNNTGSGWYSRGTNSSAKGTAFYNNGGSGVEYAGGSGSANLDHCVFDANTQDGVRMYTTPFTEHSMVVNSIFSNNGGYGINEQTGGDALAVLDYNLFYRNTSGSSNLTLKGLYNIEGLNPIYVNAASGDFTPHPRSGAIRAGMNNSNIGTVAHFPPGVGIGSGKGI